MKLKTPKLVNVQTQKGRLKWHPGRLKRLILLSKKGEQANRPANANGLLKRRPAKTHNHWSELSDLKFEIKEAFENHSQILEEKIIDKIHQVEKEITSSRSEMCDLKSEIKEVVTSLKSIETSLTDRLDKSDHDKSRSEKQVNVSKTNNIMGGDTSHNITKVEEIAVNAQELAILQEKNLAENSANSTTILELAKTQDKCISALRLRGCSKRRSSKG